MKLAANFWFRLTLTWACPSCSSARDCCWSRAGSRGPPPSNLGWWAKTMMLYLHWLVLMHQTQSRQCIWMGHLYNSRNLGTEKCGVKNIDNQFSKKFCKRRETVGCWFWKDEIKLACQIFMHLQSFWIVFKNLVQDYINLLSRDLVGADVKNTLWCFKY